MRLPLDRRPAALRVLVVAGAATLSACGQPASPSMADSVIPSPSPSMERAVELNVQFAFNSYRIQPGDYAALDATAAALIDPRLAGYHFEINGHTDIVGRLGYNIVLSRLRASTVANYLVSRGVPRELMRVQGFGPLQLIDTYNPASPANRRVEIVAAR